MLRQFINVQSNKSDYNWSSDRQLNVNIWFESISNKKPFHHLHIVVQTNTLKKSTKYFTKIKIGGESNDLSFTKLILERMVPDIDVKELVYSKT